MITTETINSMLQTLLTAVIIPGIIFLAKAGFRYLKSKTKNAALDKYLDRANKAVEQAVAETMQTFVTTMKSEGKWDTEAAKKAFEMAKMKAIEIMGAAAKQALPEIVGDVEAWLNAKIEAATLMQKAAYCL
jgi:hypothetical protein